MELRAYQQELIDKARAEMRAGNRRVLIVAPCGAGKTVLASFMCAQHAERGGRVLFLAHRRELLSQAAGTFERAGVAHIVKDHGTWIEMDKPITVMSVPTAANRAEAGKIEPPTMIITDECHHASARTYQKIYEAFPDAYSVGLTATPIRLDGKGLDGQFDAMVQGVDAGWLIANGYLAPARYISIPLHNENALHHKRMGEFVASEIEEAMADGNAIFGDAVTHYRRLADGKKAICYCHNLARSREFARRFRESGISAEHMDGDMPRAERDAVIERFRTGETQIICNVDLLGEGFDVPDCEVCIMLRPTASLGLYIQQSMRSMRMRPGKRAIIIDHVTNYKRHGLPWDVRDWTLKAEREHGGKGADAEAMYKDCPECYAVIPRFAAVCPECGYGFDEAKPRGGIEEVDAELEEVANTDTIYTVDYADTPEGRRREEAMARSYEDFIAIAKRRGYKMGWAWYRAKQRGYV